MNCTFILSILPINNRLEWILTAYQYCSMFGLIILSLLFLATLLFKNKIRTATDNVARYLIQHPAVAIPTVGVLLSVAFIIVLDILKEVAIIPGMFVCFFLCFRLPFYIGSKQMREKCLRTPALLKWLVMIAIAFAGSLILFIIFTNAGMLPGTERPYIEKAHGLDVNETHPYGSVKDILLVGIIFLVEIVISWILYPVGVLNRYLSKRLSDHRKKKRSTFTDVYFEELE